MIRCKPLRNVRQTAKMITIFILLALITGAIAVFSTDLGLPPVIGQVLFIIVISVALYYMLKYTLSDYVYELSADSFTIIKTVGKKSTVMASLSLSMTVDLVTKEEFKKNKGVYGTISKNFNYRQNPLGDYMVYIFRFNDTTVSVEFEPNDPFVRTMKERIRNNKTNI